MKENGITIDSECYDIGVLKNPEYKSELSLNGDFEMVFCFEKPRPNWWWRMWQYLFLGFKWRTK